MTKKTNYLFLFLSSVFAFLCFAEPTSGQTPVFRNYGSAEGLPSSETYCVMQDSKGYMWFGTDRGIVKFDGYTFKSFTSTEGLTDNTVFRLFEDGQQRIWYHTYSGWIGYLNKDSSYPYLYNNVVSSLTQFWYKMVPDKNGIWVNYKNDSQTIVLHIDSAGRKDFSFNSADTSVKRIYLFDNSDQHNSDLISGTEDANHIRLVSLPGKKVLADFYAKKLTSSYGYNPVHCKQKNGALWFWINGELIVLKNGKYIQRLERKDRVLSMTEDAQHNIWVGYRYRGLELFEAKHHYKKSRHFLQSHSVSDMICDREGGLWFTTLENGIYYVSPFLGLSYNKEQGLSVSKTQRIVNIDGNAVMVLSDKSVFIKYADKERVSCIHKNDWKGLQDLQYKAPDHIYYSVVQVPFAKWEVQFPFNKKATLMYMKKLHVGKRYIWGCMGTELTQYRIADGKKLNHFVFDSMPVFTCVFEKRNGEVLAGTLRGLFICKNVYKIALKKFHPMLGCRIADIKRLDSTHLVIATIGQGLLVLNENNYTDLIQYNLTDGLPSLMCNVVMPEGDNVVWIGTNRGLCRISNVKDKFHALINTADMNNGIISNEIYDISIINDELWLATALGVSVFPKAYMLKRIQDIPLYIEQVLVNDKVTDKDTYNRFPYNQNNISISFTGLNYQFTKRLLYKYRLIGIDENWSYTSNRSVIFNTLPPGTYTFEFKAIAPNKQESLTSAGYSFTIDPAFWQTWWFRLVCIIFCIAGISVFIQYRIKKVRKHVWLMNELDRFRDKALRDQMNPHFIYNSLNAIQNYILKNDTSSSASYLSKFSRLMRLTFSNTSHEQVSLEKDIEALQLYVEMENLGFREKFTFHLHLSLQYDISRIKVPPLILQPFIENAIIHGLIARKDSGDIWLDIICRDESLEISIRDNGIGREQANLLQEKKLRYRVTDNIDRKRGASGLKATVTRIEQSWGKQSGKARFSINDLYDENGQAKGTSVHFYLPLQYD